MVEPRILLVDIETAPIVAHVWQTRLWNTNVGVDQIIRDTHLLSFAAKWLGDKEIMYEDQSGVRSVKDDTRLLKSLWVLLDAADIVVVQNGVAFDLPTVMARMMAKGIQPPSPFKVVDTCTLARKKFNFSSNKLEFLAEAMGCKVKKQKHRKFPGIELWQECLDGNKEAWKEMKIYNKADVEVLEEVYLKMRPWMSQHPNVGIFIKDDKAHCPKCGSTSLHKRGTRTTEIGEYQQYYCNSCHGYSRGRTLMNDKEHRKNQLAN